MGVVKHVWSIDSIRCEGGWSYPCKQSRVDMVMVMLVVLVMVVLVVVVRMAAYLWLRACLLA